MIGPPALKFRIKKFELFVGSGAAGLALASGTTVAETAGEVPAAGDVAGTDAPATGLVSGAPVTPCAGVVPGTPASGAPGTAVVPGAAGTAGDAATPAGDVAIPAGDAATPAGDIAGLVAGGADGTWAKPATAIMTELRLTNSVFFI